MSETIEVNLGYLTHFVIFLMTLFTFIISSYLLTVRDDVKAIRQSVEEITLCVKDMKSEVDSIKQVYNINKQ